MAGFDLKNIFSARSKPEVEFTWQKFEHAEGETELVLPRKLFNAYTISETDDNWNVHDLICDVIMRSDGNPVTDIGTITYSAANIAHNTGRASMQKEISFETLNELIEKSSDPKAARYRGMNAENWRKYLETPVEYLAPSRYPTIPFGSYPQSKSGKADAPVSWFVLDIDDDGTALLLAGHGLDAGEWSKAGKRLIEWEDSSLYGWLNGEFAGRLLDGTGRDALKPVGANGGIVTLLTREEAEKYLKDDDARCATPTDYAVSRGAHSYNDRGNLKYRKFLGCGTWWVNSISEHGGFWSGIFADAVSWDGAMFCNYSPDVSWIMVRPAIHLDLKKAFGKENAERLCREFRENMEKR